MLLHPSSESNFAQLFPQQFKRFGDECQPLSWFKLTVQSVFGAFCTLASVSDSVCVMQLNNFY